MEIRKAIFMVLCLFLAGYLCFEGAEGFNNPNQGKYKTIIKKSKEVEESDIEPARAVNPRRKASENKRPWLTDTFLEMENLVFDPWDNVYRTMDWPKYAWPDGTRQNYRPDQYPDWSGCAISAPPYWNLQTQGKTYLVNIGIIKGVIRNVQVKGPAKIGKIDNLQFPVHVYANAVNGTIVKVTLFTVSIVEQGRYYGTCSAETKIENGECVCPSSSPTIYATGSTIAPGGTQTLWVDSGGLACPPYTWTVSGTGYTLSTGSTSNDLETVILTSAGGACGAGYAAVATVTATDTCGSVSSANIRNTGGKWVEKATTAQISGSGTQISGTAFPHQGTTGVYRYITGNKCQMQTITSCGWAYPPGECDGGLAQARCEAGICAGGGYGCGNSNSIFSYSLCVCNAYIGGGSGYCFHQANTAKYCEWECDGAMCLECN